MSQVPSIKVTEFVRTASNPTLTPERDTGDQILFPPSHLNKKKKKKHGRDGDDDDDEDRDDDDDGEHRRRRENGDLIRAKLLKAALKRSQDEIEALRGLMTRSCRSRDRSILPRVMDIMRSGPGSIRWTRALTASDSRRQSRRQKSAV